MTLNIPPVYKPLWVEDKRYYFLSGGRGSGKSWAVADYLLVALLKNPNLNLVCLREVQRSIKHSSKKLLSDRINKLGLNDYFEVLLTEIRLKKGNGVIIFNGLQDQSMTICYVVPVKMATRQGGLAQLFLHIIPISYK